MGQAEISQRSRLLPYFTACYPLSRAGAAPNPIQNNCTILCDYNDLDCLTGTNGTTGAQRFLTALSHRFANGFLGKCRRTGPMLALADDAALARLVIAAAAVIDAAAIPIEEARHERTR